MSQTVNQHENYAAHIVNPDRTEVEFRPTRDGYGEGLLELCRRDSGVVVLNAALPKSTRTQWVHLTRCEHTNECEWEKYQDRFMDIGISEQDMLSTAAGLALAGLVPFVTTHGVVVAGRAWNQIRTIICYPNLNVKIGGGHGGIFVGPGGATHQALEEIAIMRVLPNMTVIVPADFHETKKATLAAAETPGPVYIRFGQEPVPVVTTEATPFTVGRAETYREGTDVALVAAGAMVYEALLAAGVLAEEGISARVINSHTIKPLDRKTLLACARQCGAMVTVEEHQAAGGLGGAVAELVAQELLVPLEIVGVSDRFGESGEPDELKKAFGLTHHDVAAAARRAVERKTRTYEATG